MPGQTEMPGQFTPSRKRWKLEHVPAFAKIGAAVLLLAGVFYAGGHYRDWTLFGGDTSVNTTGNAVARRPLPVKRPRFPTMKLEAQYAGPFMDTIIQRWRDPIDGRVCYIYLPVRAKHLPSPNGDIIDYGANTIGSISCSGAEVKRTTKQ